MLIMVNEYAMEVVNLTLTIANKLAYLGLLSSPLF